MHTHKLRLHKVAWWTLYNPFTKLGKFVVCQYSYNKNNIDNLKIGFKIKPGVNKQSRELSRSNFSDLITALQVSIHLHYFNEYFHKDSIK